MKKKYFSILLAVMTLAASTSVYAAPSIGQLIPEAPKVVEGNLSDGQQLVVKEVDTGAYKNKKVADVVTTVNDANTKVTMNEVLKELDVDTTQPVKTNTNKEVNPSLYEQITPFVDLVIQENNTVTYESTGAIKATITIEAAKDVEPKNVLLMQINPETGKVSFLTVEKLDKKTGEITATFETLGPIALVEKVTIVTKDIAADKYEDKKVAQVTEKLKDEEAGFKLADFVGELTDTDGKEVELESGKVLNLEEYTSTSRLVEMAIKMSDAYSYDMSGIFLAEVNCDIDRVDWKRLVTENDADFDVAKAEDNLDLLTGIEPFTIPDSVVVQADATTGELNYVVEPELSFAYPEQEEMQDNEETVDTEETVEIDTTDEEELLNWVVENENVKNEEQPTLVMKGKFKGMGPLAIFIKESN